MVTISGGIISKEMGSSVTFKIKCDKCGYSDSSEYTITVSKGVTEVSARKCSFCGNNQVVKMKRIPE